MFSYPLDLQHMAWWCLVFGLVFVVIVKGYLFCVFILMGLMGVMGNTHGSKRQLKKAIL